MSDSSLAIVGAGVAGLGAALALADAPVEVTLFEAEDRVGGRATTRRARGCVYDVAANYVSPGDDRTPGLVRNLGTEGLVDVEPPVWTFGADGEVAPGDRPDDQKWTYESGIAEFARRLRARLDATVHLETEITALDRSDDTWSLLAGDARDGGFEAVLLTPPAPQTAEILEQSTGSGAHIATLRDAAAAVPYRAIRTLVLHYPFALDRPYYALVNTDRAHPVGWLSREECKAGHVPDGESLLIVQMAPDWSAARFDDQEDEAARAAADHAAALVGDDRLRDPDWTDAGGWRHALPDAAIDESDARAAEDAGLFVAGDWLVGTGRVDRAFWAGHDAGERIADAL